MRGDELLQPSRYVGRDRARSLELPSDDCAVFASPPGIFAGRPTKDRKADREPPGAHPAVTVLVTPGNLRRRIGSLLNGMLVMRVTDVQTMTCAHDRSVRVLHASSHTKQPTKMRGTTVWCV